MVTVLEPAGVYPPRGRIQVVPGASDLRPAKGLRTVGAVVGPLAIHAGPAGHHVAARIEAIHLPIDAQAHVPRVGPIVVTPPRAPGTGDPAPGPGLGHARGVRTGTQTGPRHNRERGGHGDVVVGARIGVTPERLNGHGRGTNTGTTGNGLRQVHAVGPQRHAGTGELTAPLSGRDLLAADKQPCRGDGPSHGHAQGHAPGQALPGQRRPRRTVG